VLANFQTSVSGADDSLFWKYGDRLLKINLCRFHVSEDAVRHMSVVFGVCRVSNDVMCDAKG